MKTKKNITITLTDEERERLLQYGYENHIGGGLSGVIAQYAWSCKIKNNQVRGQTSLTSFDDAPKPKAKGKPKA